MKTFERLAFVSFWIHIIYVPLIMIGFPVSVVLVAKGLIIESFFEKGWFPVIHSVMAIFIFYFVLYCFWFWYKFDRYSHAILLLFFLNTFYAPYYFYQVKIKKRPLKNKKPKEEYVPFIKIEKGEEIEESDYGELTRKSLIGIVELWSNKDEQLNYQKENPDFNITEELFVQWEDLFSQWENISMFFTKEEQDQLVEFDIAIKSSQASLKPLYPPWDIFMKQSEWNTINKIAIRISAHLNFEGQKD
ncbi:hypothetical protein [Carboxylicivirga caseinilyticus]|uniref:hypothetical protein n=1 Tax=Carboxylicivirga caseinilyticus TaxID=3417572 RepID=UPI003D34F949|nr:hypothetical protein [Marinilabiliaceae bacterium A049]